MARLPNKETELNIYEFKPGQRVSPNHYEYKLTGKMYHYTGNNDGNYMYYGGWIFADNSIGYIYVVYQVELNTAKKRETLIYEFKPGQRVSPNHYE